MSELSQSRSLDAPADYLLFDCEAIEESSDWRKAVWWPVPVQETMRLQRSWMRGVLNFILSEDEPDVVDSLILGFAGLATRTLPMAEAAMALQAAESIGSRIVGGPAEVSWLNGESDEGSPPIDAISHLPAISVSRYPFAKRLVLSMRWNKFWQLPRAFLRPNATVLTDNQFMASEARKSSLILAYCDAGTLFLRARTEFGNQNVTFDVSEVTERIVDALLLHCPISDPWLGRLRRMMFAKVHAILDQCAADIATIRRVRHLPERIWGGSGNAYGLRVIALEALRRGGHVTLFDHGGTTAMLQPMDAFATRELAVCSEYVMPSPRLAELREVQEATERVQPIRRPRVVGGEGELHLIDLPLRRPTRARTRPRVVYVSALLRGFHRTGLIPLPDPVYLEWQLRVAEALQDLPIDLICKPHPEGVFRGRRHPLESVAPTTYVPFEQTMADADIFVFDRCASTTFWEAVCTDRPIVYFDMEILEFSEEVGEMFRDRCRVVPVQYDNWNRPRFDSACLREAVLDASSLADPTKFQELLIGQAV